MVSVKLSFRWMFYIDYGIVKMGDGGTKFGGSGEDI